MRDNLLKKYLLLGLTLLVPTLTLAEFRLGVDTPTTFGDTITYILEVINILNPLLLALAFIVFFWGVSKFILNANNKAELDKGKKYMLWGVLALFILVTFRAIIGWVSNDLEIGSKDPSPSSILLPTR